jgi:type IV secretion system protein VirB8
LDSKIATLEFTYKPNLKMDEEKRIENPLGFQVTSYRVDSDYAASPPIEVPAPAATPDAMPAPPGQDPAIQAPAAPGVPPQPAGAAAGPAASAAPPAAGNPGTPNGDSNR